MEKLRSKLSQIPDNHKKKEEKRNVKNHRKTNKSHNLPTLHKPQNYEGGQECIGTIKVHL
jgi:hypothetical protein